MLSSDFKEFAALLNSNGVEYLVVGSQVTDRPIGLSAVLLRFSIDEQRWERQMPVFRSRTVGLTR